MMAAFPAGVYPALRCGAGMAKGFTPIRGLYQTIRYRPLFWLTSKKYVLLCLRKLCISEFWKVRNMPFDATRLFKYNDRQIEDRKQKTENRRRRTNSDF